MGTILTPNNLQQISKLKKSGKTIVLTGGSFDILHAGHIEFLKQARSLGDILIVMLEPDEKIRKIKGENRPVNTQNDRAKVLSGLPAVSFVLNLTNLQRDSDYEILVKRLEPDIIATSGSDKVFDWEKNLAQLGKIRIVKVMERIGDYSTTKIIKQLKSEII